MAGLVTMISIGGIIGTGLFVGSSAAIAAAGPGIVRSYGVRLAAHAGSPAGRCGRATRVSVAFDRWRWLTYSGLLGDRAISVID